MDTNVNQPIAELRRMAAAELRRVSVMVHTYHWAQATVHAPTNRKTATGRPSPAST